jgi:hypothetical protein
MKNTVKYILYIAISLFLAACAKDIVDFTGSVHGVVKDYETGEFITNCQVSLHPGGNSVTTSTSGEFEFANLTPGEYTLTFNKSGYDEESKTIVIDASRHIYTDFMLKAKSNFSLSDEAYNFGDLNAEKTIVCFNNTDENCTYEVVSMPEWLSINKPKGLIYAGSSSSFTMHVDRSQVNYGTYSGNVTISFKGKKSGDANISISMSKVKLTTPTLSIAPYPTTMSEDGFEIIGTLQATGGAQVTEHGHCWGLNPAPTIADSRTKLGGRLELGDFISTTTGLKPNTTYYVRAYAVNSQGVAYSEDVVVTMQDVNSDRWDGSMAKAFAGGIGTESNPYKIKTGSQLVLIKQYPDAHFVLCNNIDLDNRPWPIVNLNGSFDGGGYTIYNLKITRPAGNDNVGLFAKFGGNRSSGTTEIKNLTINGVDIDAGTNSNVGALIGSCHYTVESISNCHVILNQGSKITGYNLVGGMIGDGYDSEEITNCTVISNINENVIIGNKNVGGMTGADGILSNCHVQANIAGTDYVGGIVGAGGGTINNSSYKGILSGSSYVGGIAGEIGNVYASKVEAVINAKNYAGGIVGRQYASSSKIIGCYSSGTINCDGGSGKSIGGISGYYYHSVEFNYTTMTSNYADYIEFGNNSKDCAAVTSQSKGYMTNCQLSCTNITEFLQNCYSEHADYFNFNNTWTWTGTINGITVNVSCPKLYWED